MSIKNNINLLDKNISTLGIGNFKMLIKTYIYIYENINMMTSLVFSPHDETLENLSSFFFFWRIFQVVLNIHVYFLMKIKCIFSDLFLTYKQ